MEVELKTIGYVYSTRNRMQAVFGPSKNWLVHSPHGLILIEAAEPYPDAIKQAQRRDPEWVVMGTDKAAYAWVKYKLDNYASSKAASVKD